MTWMLFWMRRQGRALKGELENSVSLALAAGRPPRWSAWRSSPSSGKGSRRRSSSSPSGFTVGRRHRRRGRWPDRPRRGGRAGLGDLRAGCRINLGRFFTVTGDPAHLRGGGAHRVCHRGVHGGRVPARAAAAVRPDGCPAAVVAAGLRAHGSVRIPGGTIGPPGRGVPAVPGAGARSSTSATGARACAVARYASA